MEKINQQCIHESEQVISNDRNLALFAHLAFFGGLIVPFMGLIAPLVLWQMNKDKSPFMKDHAVEALNANLTIVLAFIISGVLCAVLIGFILVPIVFVIAAIFCIKGALAASNGKSFRYPYIFRFIKS